MIWKRQMPGCRLSAWLSDFPTFSTAQKEPCQLDQSLCHCCYILFLTSMDSIWRGNMFTYSCDGLVCSFGLEIPWDAAQRSCQDTGHPRGSLCCVLPLFPRGAHGCSFWNLTVVLPGPEECILLLSGMGLARE